MRAGKNRTNRIVADPKVMMGKPVIRGTRITVEIILEKLAAGLDEKEILEDYPRLTRADIRAALEYASHAVGSEEIHRAGRYRALMRAVSRDPRYRNRWVAVLNGRVIDSDTWMEPLVRRVLRGPETPVQIGYASAEGRLPVAHVPGVRVRRK